MRLRNWSPEYRGQAPATTETMPRFRAEWKTISFANALHLRLTPADCELLKQLRRELMPKLAIRVVRDRMRCSSDLASGYRPQLLVAALVALPERSSVAEPPGKVRSADSSTVSRRLSETGECFRIVGGPRPARGHRR